MSTPLSTPTARTVILTHQLYNLNLLSVGGVVFGLVVGGRGKGGGAGGEGAAAETTSMSEDGTDDDEHCEEESGGGSQRNHDCRWHSHVPAAFDAALNCVASTQVFGGGEEIDRQLLITGRQISVPINGADLVRRNNEKQEEKATLTRPELRSAVLFARLSLPHFQSPAIRFAST